MFALEIAFKDGVSQDETILVRRPQALIGSHDFAHVALEDMRSLNYQIRLVRELGRRFRCAAVTPDGDAPGERLDRVYDGEASLDLGPVSLYITALDVDLMPKEGEPPDRAGVRVLRQSCSGASPIFPAAVVLGAYPMVVSFNKDQSILIGRSKECALRLDSSAISAQHARLGFEEGRFWIEDLGSTNGTFVQQQQIAGRVDVTPETPVILGREISLIGVTSYDQVAKIASISASAQDQLTATAAEPKYPILVSLSEVARPARLVVSPGSPLRIGRDPSSEMWLGAPHISRTHCSVTLRRDGSITVNDNSTNGTSYGDGILRRGDVLQLEGRPTALDFGGGVTVAICFNEEHERRFVESQGSPTVFRSTEGSIEDAGIASEQAGPRSPVPPSGEERPRAPRAQALLSRVARPLRVASRVQLLIVTVTFAFAFFLIASLLRGVFFV